MVVAAAAPLSNLQNKSSPDFSGELYLQLAAYEILRFAFGSFILFDTLPGSPATT